MNPSGRVPALALSRLVHMLDRELVLQVSSSAAVPG